MKLFSHKSIIAATVVFTTLVRYFFQLSYLYSQIKKKPFESV